MKRVAILTNYQREYVKYDMYFESEQFLKKVFAEKWLELNYVSPYYYNEDLGHFTEHVVIGEDDMEIVKEAYQPDLLWVKMGTALYHIDEMFKFAPFVTVPSMRLKHIESNKYQVYKYLSEHQPHSCTLSTFYFYPWMQEKFADKLVVKPLSGTGGYGVEFFTQDELRSPDIFNQYAGMEAMHLVQDYKNFSKWVPGLAEGNHDVRITFMGHDPIMNYIRIPKAGSLKSNIAAGGSQFSIDMADMPKELLEKSASIQELLKVQAQDMYSLDYAYCADEQEWYLIEINSAPGIWFPEKDRDHQQAFFDNLAYYFTHLIDTHNDE